MQGNLIESLLCNVHLLISSFRFWYQRIMYKTRMQRMMKYWFQIKINYSCFEILKKRENNKTSFYATSNQLSLEGRFIQITMEIFLFHGNPITIFSIWFFIQKTPWICIKCGFWLYKHKHTLCILCLIAIYMFWSHF